MSNTFHCYANPSSRLQLLILLNAYSSQPAFPPLAPILVTHPLFQSLVLSLQVDGSSTACTVGLTFFAKLLPILAVYAPEALKSNLPQFLTILAGVISWKTRQPSIDSESVLNFERGDDTEVNKLEICSHLEWERLELTFNATASVAPSADRYFTHLYYLFPCNVLEFVRHPIEYLDRHGAECPYTAGWAVVLDDDKVRKKSEVSDPIVSLCKANGNASLCYGGTSFTPLFFLRRMMYLNWKSHHSGGNTICPGLSANVL